MDADEFNDHPLWATANSVKSLFDDQPAYAPEQWPGLDRLRFLHSQLLSYREGDPELFVRSQLDEAHSLWGQVNSYLATARSNIGYESNAVAQAEEWLVRAGSWHKPTKSGPLAQQAKEAYERLIDSYRAALDALQRARKEDTESWDQERQTLQSKVSELETQVEAAKDKLSAMETRVAVGEATIQTNLTNQAETFRAAQDERATDFTDWIKKQEADFTSLAAPHVEAIESMESSSRDVLARIKELGDQVEIAAGLTTGDVLAGAFKQSAKNELITSIITFSVGILASAAGVTWLYWVALSTFDSDRTFSPTWLLAKLSLALAVGGLATVLIRHGQHAQTTARGYKRTELELRAIGPYLSDIEDRTVAEKAKVSFLRRTFGRDGTSGPAQGTELEDGELLKKSLDVLSTVVTKLPK